ncbi:MAG: hypothetical protein R3E98_03160 [Gemmatimonadota bacterium]
MRTSTIVVLAAGAAVTFATPSVSAAQVCMGQPTRVAAISLGFEGTDGATGGAASLAVRAGRLNVGVSRSSLDMFAQKENMRTTDLRVGWELTDGPVQVCGLAGEARTSYESSLSSRTGPDANGVVGTTYDVDGDFDRVRRRVGLSLGHEFRSTHTLGLNPFVTLAVVQDHERMRWLDGDLTTRTRTGPGTSFGLAARIGSTLIRSELAKTWTAERALSQHTNWWHVGLQVGWAF